MSDENKSRISLVCAPHDGSRSPAFLKFQRDFRAGTQAEFIKDDEYSVWQALNDVDQGGQDANAPAMPGGNALAPAQRKRLRRQALAYKMAYAHVDDERIREMLDALNTPDRLGADAWQLILRECGEGTSDLTRRRFTVAENIQ